MKTTILLLQNLQADRMEDRQQLSFWEQVQTQNRTGIKNSGSRIAFEFGPNLLGVQTDLVKSDKFPRIFNFHDLLECEFRLTWLYGKI
jgi:hypothetical protein